MHDDAPNPDHLRKIIAEATETRRQAEELLKELEAVLRRLTAESCELDPPASDDRD